MKNITPLEYTITDPLIRAALAEDIGRIGDITSAATIPDNKMSTLVIKTRQDGCLAGLDMALRSFTIIDPEITITTHKNDGDRIKAGDVLATVTGRARALLTAERTCLNLLGHLSGIATQTQNMVDLIAHTNARLVDTRKTLPGLRAVQKYAVRCGGGYNHRFALDDAVMIKDNHIAVCGSITQAVAAARESVGHTTKIEIEVDNLDQLREVLTTDADIVLLDNMPPALLKQAVKMVNGKMVTEASGNINAKTIASVAETGVDYISAGCLTHSVMNVDIGLDYIAQNTQKEGTNDQLQKRLSAV